MIFTPLGWLLFIYSAFLSAIAFALWYSILKYNKAGEISIYKFATPVSGAILSALFIPGEKLTVFIVGALLLVAIGFVAVIYKSPAARSSQHVGKSAYTNAHWLHRSHKIRF